MTNVFEYYGLKVPNKFQTPINYVSPNVYDYIEECHKHESIVKILRSMYAKALIDVFARHLLATCCQHPSESIGNVLKELRKIS